MAPSIMKAREVAVLGTPSLFRIGFRVSCGGSGGGVSWLHL